MIGFSSPTACANTIPALREETAKRPTYKQTRITEELFNMGVRTERIGNSARVRIHDAQALVWARDRNYGQCGAFHCTRRRESATIASDDMARIPSNQVVITMGDKGGKKDKDKDKSKKQTAVKKEQAAKEKRSK